MCDCLYLRDTQLLRPVGDPRTLHAYLDSNTEYEGNSVKWVVAGQCEESGAGPKLEYGRKTESEELSDFLSARVDGNLPTMVRVDYGTDANLTYDHFVVCVGRKKDGDFVMNDPATHKGDGYEHTTDANSIQRTPRKAGYRIVKLDYCDPK